MWHDILAALALMLVFEGIMPFVNPQRFRRTLMQAAQMKDEALRAIGFACMVGGVVVLYVVR